MDLHERYTHGHHESVLRSHEWRTLENSGAYFAGLLRPGLSVLDVGSGPGTITFDLAQRVAPGTVVGVDYSHDIVEHARRSAAERGVTNVRFEQGDAYALDVADDTFDVVHAHQVLQHVGDPIAVLREFRRVTRPGGIVVARDVDWGGTMWAPLLPGLGEWMRVNQAVQRANGGEPFAGRLLRSWALEAGFARVDSSASIWCFASDEERRWWGESWSVRVTESDFGRHARDEGIADDAALAEISAAWLEWSRHANGWYGMPHGEIVAHV
ncbi:class I SAM-dependent methyltransferase [Leifsonia sp. F6_8S_P_1B]|uniref:Class I SAM-dependent methyltransferase n=1 Tax=Leifsonia williamsii TaxID=3035919 RepID=A0ABT8KD81_9MICO|nr:class I SAM-dependent methyltransferase [Leifsonia williamsii]MDN4615132.1 class I SAM-dependent methyltransferase [Leifsonia williamsii]